jgi:hypothetical protein
MKYTGPILFIFCFGRQCKDLFFQLESSRSERNCSLYPSFVGRLDNAKRTETQPDRWFSGPKNPGEDGREKQLLFPSDPLEGLQGFHIDI